jgi:hypothetical protein
VPKLLIVVAALLFSVAVLSPQADAQGRPDCAAVMRAMHKMKKHRGAVDALDLAESIGSDSVWVEKCAATYGRRVKHRNKAAGDDDELTERREEDEYEELAREEKEMQANAVQEDLRNGVYSNGARGVNPDDSMEWEPFITHEWEPYVTHEWNGPYIHNDDDPGFD